MKAEHIAFWSYVHADDEHDDGRITALWKRLSGEIEMQTGEKLSIFQDRDSLLVGQSWQEVLDNAVDRAPLLIPILTPRYFKSDACRRELERFLAHEKTVARNDLILPLYYTNCPDGAARQADKLATTIFSRQYDDWRALRFEPLTSPEIAKRLVALTEQIIAALDRSKQAAATAPARKPAQQARQKTKEGVAAAAKAPSSDTETASEAATSSEAGSAAPPPAAETASAIRIEPKTLIVRQMGPGDHKTISDALKAAEAGTIILVRPGTYREGLLIDKPVEIIGDGPREEIVIETRDDRETIKFATTLGRIKNLTLRRIGDARYFCVNITQGELTLQSCDISGGPLSCVVIRGEADPRLHDNRIHGTGQYGILIDGNGRGTLEDNEIFETGMSAIYIRGDGNPTLRRNRIHHSKHAGLAVYQRGRATIEDNEIFETDLSAVTIGGDGYATLRRNRLHHTKQSGLFFYDQARGTIEGNEIFSNALNGVAIRENANPVLRDNHIRDNDKSGIRVEGGKGQIEKNQITSNKLVGISIRDKGNPTCRDNQIHLNAFEAIWIHSGGGGTFEDNDLSNNKKGPWDIADDCLPNVTRSNNKE